VPEYGRLPEKRKMGNRRKFMKEAYGNGAGKKKLKQFRQKKL